MGNSDHGTTYTYTASRDNESQIRQSYGLQRQQACHRRADREKLKKFEGLVPESRGRILALTVLYVPNSPDSGWRVTTWGVRESPLQWSRGTLSLTHTLSHTLSHTQTHTHKQTHSLSHFLSLSLTHTHSLTHSHTHKLSLSLTHTCTHTRCSATCARTRHPNPQILNPEP